jgi:hypothetical protein
MYLSLFMAFLTAFLKKENVGYRFTLLLYLLIREFKVLYTIRDGCIHMRRKNERHSNGYNVKSSQNIV